MNNTVNLVCKECKGEFLGVGSGDLMSCKKYDKYIGRQEEGCRACQLERIKYCEHNIRLGCCAMCEALKEKCPHGLHPVNCLVCLNKGLINQVDHPAHYGGADDPYEVIKVMERWLPPDEFRGALKFNIHKYLARAGKKGTTLQDEQKAAWYADYLAKWEERIAKR